MLFHNVAIDAMAYELPPHRITSAELEEQIAETMTRLGIEKGKIERPTGIRERHFWDVGVTPSSAATLVAQKVIEKSGIDPNEIGCLISTSITKDYIEPSVASLIHGNLKLSSRCINFDITNACLGFLDGINTISLMIESGVIKYGLVVSGECMREGVEATIKLLQSPDVTNQIFYDNFASLTLGSGAVSMLLAHKDLSKSGHLIEGSVNLSATEHNRLCIAQRNYMKTDSRTLLTAGAELVLRTWQIATETFEKWGDEFTALYVPHQVSIKQIEAFASFIGVDMHKVYLTLHTLGNMASAALPFSLAMAADEGRLNPGDQAVLVGVGSGINCSIMRVMW